MNHKREALAFRILAYANAREWNVTSAEIAEALGLSTKAVAQIAIHRRWTSRMRTLSNGGNSNRHDSASHYIAADLVAGRIGNDAGY